jgi:hypothetical protein
VTLVLMDEGLDRDEAMHVIGIVLLGIIGDVVVEDRSRATPPPRPLGARPGLWMAAWAFHIFRTVPERHLGLALVSSLRIRWPVFLQQHPCMHLQCRSPCPAYEVSPDRPHSLLLAAVLHGSLRLLARVWRWQHTAHLSLSLSLSLSLAPHFNTHMRPVCAATSVVTLKPTDDRALPTVAMLLKELFSGWTLPE